MPSQLAWPPEIQNAWLSVRAWLLGEPQVTRVDVDYWVLIAQVPQEVRRTRLHVLPLHNPEAEDTTTPNSVVCSLRHMSCEEKLQYLLQEIRSYDKCSKGTEIAERR